MRIPNKGTTRIRILLTDIVLQVCKKAFEMQPFRIEKDVGDCICFTVRKDSRLRTKAVLYNKRSFEHLLENKGAGGLVDVVVINLETLEGIYIADSLLMKTRTFGLLSTSLYFI